MSDTEPTPEPASSTADSSKKSAAQSVPKHFSVVDWAKANPVEAVLFAGTAGFLLFFYGIWQNYGNQRELSPIQWMWNTCWHPQKDYQHGLLIPLIILALVIYRWPKLLTAKKSSEWWGLAIAIIGVLFFVLAARVVQARVAAGSLPFVAFGLIAYIWGRDVARYMFFPCCLIFFAIPIPGLLQATNDLQIFSTKSAAVVGKLFDIELFFAGSKINSVPAGKWDFEVDEGCSGIRSLVALTLISAIYGHLTQDRLWKKVLLLVAALPLAVLANAVRISSIILIAEFWSDEFAGGIYHNWSGFIFFLLVGLAGLLLLSWAINGGIKKLFNKSSTTRIVRSGTTS